MGQPAPLISVIMSVYKTDNGYLREAIESILNQSYKNFEFIIIDDCTPTDNIETILSYVDSRIRLICNERNLGLTRSLNKAIRLATGKYLARMDSDDVSELDRLAKQVAYMENNPDTLVLGGYAQILGSNRIFMSKVTDFETLKIRMIFYNCALVHPTAMLNKELLSKYEIFYDETVSKAQDYMLWTDCIAVKKLAVLDEVILQYRIHEGQASIASREEQQRCAMRVQKKLLEPLLGSMLTDEIQRLHYSIVSGKYLRKIEDYHRHFRILLKGNQQKQIYPLNGFRRECYYMWLLMTVKGIVLHKDFRGLASTYFWRAMLRLDFWAHYYESFIKQPLVERSVMKKSSKEKVHQVKQVIYETQYEMKR